MTSQTDILQQIQLYLQKYPLETERLSSLVKFVNTYEGEMLYNRKNFNGHLTASAFIVNSKNDKVLLLKHKSLNRWLQPGGHVDSADASLIDAALREAKEETGIAEKFLRPVYNTVFDFDSHLIPENTRKQEPAHYHHDVRFLFDCTSTNAIEIAEDESTDSSWLTLDELDNIAEFKLVVQKIRKVLQEKVSVHA